MEYNTMFDELTRRLNQAFRKLRGRGKLSPGDVDEALRDVRRALLEADVNIKVAKDFTARVGEKAVGQEVLNSISPGQMVVKIVHDELIALLGGQVAGLKLGEAGPAVIMLVGLQGSGKTTVAGKLARHLKAKSHKVIMAAADVYRPAAVEQLCQLGERIGIEVFWSKNDDPVRICRQAVDLAGEKGLEAVILDTAGRWHVDDEMMSELEHIREEVSPQEILLVADAMTGQEAVNLAGEFERRLKIDGVVLTKMDGDARGGAALSIMAVTGKPIKFVGVGEKLDALEPFYPDRMASRILGMGDVVTLVEKAQAAIDADEQKKLERKLREKAFTFRDFLSQLRQLKKMGPLENLLEMMPGVDLKGIQVDEGALVRIEAMINSMTPEERDHPRIIDGSRRKRIARGSGRTIQEVNQLLKQFSTIRQMIEGMDETGWQKALLNRRPKMRRKRRYR
jgi:signal recognition particle subunit SRP54